MTIVRDHAIELYRSRALIESLVRREVRARYRGSALGFLWSLLNPLLLLVVYHFVFATVLRTEIPHYAVFLLAGLLPWQWLATALANGATAMTGAAGLITRACLPPHVFPAVVVLANLVNFLLALPVAVVAAAYAGVRPGPALAAVPLLVAVQCLFVYGLTLLVATLNVRFRDVQFLVPTLVMVWFFATPIVYGIGLVPAPYRAVLAYLNPGMSIVVPYQALIHGGALPAAATLLLGLAWAVAVAVAAVVVYERLRFDIVEDL